MLIQVFISKPETPRRYIPAGKKEFTDRKVAENWLNSRIAQLENKGYLVSYDGDVCF